MSTTPTEARFRPGDVLVGKYRVERVIGEGGMGSVLGVHHLLLGEARALKVMLPDLVGEAESRERFLREARAVARLKSEHVSKVFDVGVLPGGEPYIEMELLVGTDLADLLDERGPLPLALVAGWVRQACSALAEAHALGIVHRDLKPANLFVTRGKDGDCVKVLDFGIAKMDQGDRPALTQTTSTFGSPFYMSPEQMISARSADARSDVWALGVILYELATGKVPFEAETVTAVAVVVSTREPIPPSRHRPDLPASLESIILKCLAKSPDARFQSVTELARMLQLAALPAGPADWDSTGVVSVPTSGVAPTPRVAGAPALDVAATQVPRSSGGVPGVTVPSQVGALQLPAPASPRPVVAQATLPSAQPTPRAASFGSSTQSPVSQSVKASPRSSSGLVVAVALATAAVVATLGVLLLGGSSTEAPAAGASGEPTRAPDAPRAEGEPARPSATATAPIEVAPTAPSASASSASSAAPVATGPRTPPAIRKSTRKPKGFDGVD